MAKEFSDEEIRILTSRGGESSSESIEDINTKVEAAFKNWREKSGGSANISQFKKFLDEQDLLRDATVNLTYRDRETESFKITDVQEGNVGYWKIEAGGKTFLAPRPRSTGKLEETDVLGTEMPVEVTIHEDGSVEVAGSEKGNEVSPKSEEKKEVPIPPSPEAETQTPETVGEQKYEITDEIKERIEGKLVQFWKELIGKDLALNISFTDFTASTGDIIASRKDGIEVVVSTAVLKIASESMFGESIEVGDSRADDLTRELGERLISEIQEELTAIGISAEASNNQWEIREMDESVMNGFLLTITSEETKGNIAVALSHEAPSGEGPIYDVKEADPERDAAVKEGIDIINAIEDLKKESMGLMQKISKEGLQIGVDPLVEALGKDVISDEVLEKEREKISHTDDIKKAQESAAKLTEEYISLHDAFEEIYSQYYDLTSEEEEEEAEVKNEAPPKPIEKKEELKIENTKESEGPEKIQEILQEANDLEKAYFDAKDEDKNIASIIKKWDSLIEKALQIAENLDQKEVNYVEIYDASRNGSDVMKMALAKLTPEEKKIPKEDKQGDFETSSEVDEGVKEEDSLATKEPEEIKEKEDASGESEQGSVNEIVQRLIEEDDSLEKEKEMVDDPDFDIRTELTAEILERDDAEAHLKNFAEEMIREIDEVLPSSSGLQRVSLLTIKDSLGDLIREEWPDDSVGQRSYLYTLEEKRKNLMGLMSTLEEQDESLEGENLPENVKNDEQAVNQNTEESMEDTEDESDKEIDESPEIESGERETIPLSESRLRYLKALKLRGNIIRGKVGEIVLGRTMEFDGKEVNLSGNQGEEILEKLAEQYEQGLNEYRQKEIRDLLNERKEDISDVDKNHKVQMKILDLLQEEQNLIDDAVLNKFEETFSEKFRRRWWRSKKATWARIGGGLTLSAASAGLALTGVGAVGILGARTLLGGTGTYFMTEGMLERTKWIGHKGLTDKIYKKYNGNLRAISDVLESGEYSDEEIRNEAARLRMLQIEKGTRIDSSYHKEKPQREVIALILKQERRIIANSALERNEAGEKKEAIVMDELLGKLDREIKEGNYLLNDAEEDERDRKMIRKILSATAGSLVGGIVGSKAITFLGGEDVATTTEAPVSGETTEVVPDTTETTEATPSETSVEPSETTPETIGVKQIVIDEPGEGMIKAIAQHFEEAQELEHTKAMKIANLMYLEGMKEYSRVIEGLIGQGVDIDALKELEFTLTEEKLDADSWIQKMQKFLESEGVNPSSSGAQAKMLYEDGKMFNLVHLNDSFSLDLSKVSAADLQNLSAEEIVEKMGGSYDSGTFASAEETPIPDYNLPKGESMESIRSAIEVKGEISESRLSEDVKRDYIEKLKALIEGHETSLAENAKNSLDIDVRLEIADREAQLRELLDGLLDDDVEVIISQEQWELYESLNSIESARNAGMQEVLDKVGEQPVRTLPPQPLTSADAEGMVNAQQSVNAAINKLSEAIGTKSEFASEHVLSVLTDAYEEGENSKIASEVFRIIAEANTPLPQTLTTLQDEQLSLLDTLVDSHLEENAASLENLSAEDQETIGELREYIDALLKQRGK